MQFKKLNYKSKIKISSLFGTSNILHKKVKVGQLLSGLWYRKHDRNQDLVVLKTIW